MILWEHFDRNEWFVLLLLLAVYAAVVLLPKRFTRGVLILALLWGFASSTLLDFTIGGGLMDYYRVHDSNRYEITDFFTYVMFAPFAYFFIYFYELLRIYSRLRLMLYIIGWTIVGYGFQWVAEWMNMTHYQKGYRIEYNLVVFLLVQSITGLFYRYIRSQLNQNLFLCEDQGGKQTSTRLRGYLAARKKRRT